MRPPAADHEEESSSPWHRGRPSSYFGDGWRGLKGHPYFSPQLHKPGAHARFVAHDRRMRDFFSQSLHCSRPDGTFLDPIGLQPGRIFHPAKPWRARGRRKNKPLACFRTEAGRTTSLALGPEDSLHGLLTGTSQLSVAAVKSHNSPPISGLARPPYSVFNTTRRQRFGQFPPPGGGLPGADISYRYQNASSKPGGVPSLRPQRSPENSSISGRRPSPWSPSLSPPCNSCLPCPTVSTGTNCDSWLIEPGAAAGHFSRFDGGPPFAMESVRFFSLFFFFRPNGTRPWRGSLGENKKPKPLERWKISQRGPGHLRSFEHSPSLGLGPPAGRRWTQRPVLVSRIRTFEPHLHSPAGHHFCGGADLLPSNKHRAATAPLFCASATWSASSRPQG